eukprot:CAMPEP_0172211832 /NCGR_PEP_ID=MMETSP1050-20130122/36632_1 /TAXON_ID=233186 /ORGANISM="Cryptomonas curvata, Strain CCAP979/52" /LENGTH=166 /DNA_ID=CAMNT_0012892349 /DNA_START=83 /DNA_END=584 /DNA_ORIENTATION=-
MYAHGKRSNRGGGLEGDLESVTGLIAWRRHSCQSTVGAPLSAIRGATCTSPHQAAPIRWTPPPLPASSRRVSLCNERAMLGTFHKDLQLEPLSFSSGVHRAALGWTTLPEPSIAPYHCNVQRTLRRQPDPTTVTRATSSPAGRGWAVQCGQRREFGEERSRKAESC